MAINHEFYTIHLKGSDLIRNLRRRKVENAKLPYAHRCSGKFIIIEKKDTTRKQQDRYRSTDTLGG